MIYSVDSYGAVGDGKHSDTDAIQKAIDDCFAAGGGVVNLSGGKTYVSGSVILKSNVELHLENGTVLKASSEIADYYKLREYEESSDTSKIPSYVNCEYAGKPYQAFIYAYDCENVVISGNGSIDGNESMYYGDDTGYHIEGAYYPRVPMLLLEKMKHLTISDVTLRNCGFWTLHMIGCDDILVDGIRILNNLRMANSDGIDPDHCRNLRINNCHVECGDDCIVLKNTKDYIKYGPTENVTISNCTLISTSAAIKFGTEGESDFNNIVVQNCTISKSNRGISLQIRDCGNVSNVMFSNITIETRRFSNEWWGSAEPICVTAFDRKPGVKAGHIKNVVFRDIYCKGENGVLLHGSEDNHLEGIILNNINIELIKTSKWDIDGYDLRPRISDRKLKTKINGIYARNTDKLQMNNITVECYESMKKYFDKDINVI